MAEPLAVDPARLIAAASKLTELVFPAPPAAIAAAGMDPMSAAINETMPGIESLVSDGLPGVAAALKRTATSMGAAADVYTKADQSLGAAMAQYGFGGDGQSFGANAVAAATGGLGAQMLGGPAGAAQQLAAASGGAAAAAAAGQQLGAQAAALTPQIQATVPQLIQLAPLAQQMAPMGQQVGQSVQQAASQASQGGGSSAQLAGDAKPDNQEKDDQEDDQADGQPADGATAGQATLVSAPVADASGGKPDSVAAPT